VPDDYRSTWAQYTVRASDEPDRQRIMGELKERGVPTVVYYPRPLHRQSAYASYPADPAGLGMSEQLSSTVFSLPMHPYLEPETQDRIIDAVLDAVGVRAGAGAA
jgi:dTDP-4-amino-4,6-dideoxygalactose transaminase